MNRSFSKIRHIKEANERLENRLLNEKIISEDDASMSPTSAMPDPIETTIMEFLKALGPSINNKIVFPAIDVLKNWYENNKEKFKKIVDRFLKKMGKSDPVEVWIGNRRCY